MPSQVVVAAANVKSVSVPMRVRYANRGDIESLQDFDICIDWNSALQDNSRIIVVFEEEYIVGYYLVHVGKVFKVESIGGDERALKYIVKELKGRAKKTGRKMVSIEVSQYLTDLQTILKHNQFICISTLREGSSYLMIWRTGS